MNVPGRTWKLAALALLCGMLAARRSSATELNRVTAVERLAEAGKLSIHGTAQPSFTVFKLSSPPRLVIDLAGADVSGMSGASGLKTGAVQGVTAAQFDQGGQRVGRLVVALASDAQYDVKAQGNDLLVAVNDPVPATSAVPAQSAAAPGAGSPGAAAEPPAGDPNVVTTREDSIDTAKPAHKLSAVTVREQAGQTQVRVAADGEIARYSLIELRDPARLALDLHGVAGVAKKIGGQGAINGVRVARHEDGVRVVLDGQGAQLPQYQVIRRSDGLEVRLGAPAVAKSDAAPARPAPAPAPPEPARAEVKLAAAKPAPAQTEIAQPAVAKSDAPVAAPPASAKAETKPAPAAEETPGAPKSEVAQKIEAAPAPEAAQKPAKVKLATVRAVDLDESAEHTQVQVAIEGTYKFEVGHPDAKSVVLTIAGATLPERLERNLDATALGGQIDMLSSYRVPEKDGHPAQVKVVASLHAPCGDAIEAHSGGLTWKFDVQAPIAQAAQPVAARAGAMTTDQANAQPNVLDDRNYSGRRVDFNVKDIDIRNLLGAISDISKKNIIIADDVHGTVTIKLRNVPWDQALDIILKSKSLGKEEVGNIIRVAPIDRLRQEQKDAADAAKVKQTYEPLKVRLIAVNYATAATLVDKVKDSLTERGSVTVDTRTNTLIVKDVQDAIIRAEGIVRNLDTQTPEVLIESRIVEATVSFSREAGIQWGGNVSLNPANGNATGLQFPNILNIAGAADDATASVNGLTGVTTPNFAVNMPAAIGVNSGGGIGFVLGSAGGAAQLNLRLSAAENSGNLKTISSPRVQTLDNIEATISQGVQIPFSQVSASGVNTQFIEANLELRVTPHVTQEGGVQLKIQATNNQPDASLTGSNGQPAISNRSARTQVLVKDGDTSVIGGIYTRQNSESWDEVPVLSRIPILGWLFKKKTVSDNRDELLIFITPHIVNRSESAVANATEDAKP